MKVALFVVLGAAVVHADPTPDASFTWQAPSTCPDAADVRARIERRLGHPLDRDVVGIEVDVEVAPTGYVAKIDARAVTVDNDIRTLTSARCDELADGVAIVVARLTTEAKRTAAPAVTRTTTTTRRMTPAFVADQINEPAPPRPWGGGIRALGLSGIGRVPEIGVGGELAIFVHHRDKFAEVAAAKWMGSHITVPDGTIDFGLDLLTLRAGWAPERMPVRGWLSGEVGMRAGSSMGPSRWTAVGAGFGVAWPMSPELRLVGTFEIDVPIERPPVELDSGAEVFKPAWLTAYTALGLEVAWL